jgi:chromate transporter
MGAALIWFKLFWSFFKIGLFGFGGGYGMISLIQNEVVEKQAWISNSEFTDIVAVSQMTPGPIGINSATYVGFKAIENAGYYLPRTGRGLRYTCVSASRH